MGVVAILVMWPGPFEQTLFPRPKESPYEIWVKLAQWFQRCLKMLMGGRRMDGRRSDWYTISLPMSLRHRWAKLELWENLTIAPLQCFAYSKRTEFLRILSGNVILTSIDGHNSLTNFQKMTANNHNVDLVSIKQSYKVWSKSVHFSLRYWAEIFF